MHLTIQGYNIGVYKACVKDAKSFKYPSKPFLFSNMNNIDLDTVSEHLPTLTEVKEIIITYIYIHLQVVQVYRQQY
jgi:hypothetical protein